MFQSFSLFTRELRAMSLAVAFLGFVLFALFFHSGRQHLKTGRNNFVCPRFCLTELMFQLYIFPFHCVCYSNFGICILIFLIPRKPNCKCSFPLDQCDLIQLTPVISQGHQWRSVAGGIKEEQSSCFDGNGYLGSLWSYV